MEVEIASAGKESADVALRFFRDHLTAVFAQVRENFGIAYDVETALRHDEEELPKFLPPTGRMLIAHAGGRALGIGCLKTIGIGIGEVKHLFVSPDTRGLGVGRRLMEAVIREARTMGIGTLRLDSGRFQTPAHALYRSLGFVEIPRYPENQISESEAHILLFMELNLGDGE